MTRRLLTLTLAAACGWLVGAHMATPSTTERDDVDALDHLGLSVVHAKIAEAEFESGSRL